MLFAYHTQTSKLSHDNIIAFFRHKCIPISYGYNSAFGKKQQRFWRFAPDMPLQNIRLPGKHILEEMDDK
jgi:hypothetical protein